jgi:hypothetical protein
MELILIPCENNRTSSVVWSPALFDIASSASTPTISQAGANSVLNSEQNLDHRPGYLKVGPGLEQMSKRQSGVARSRGTMRAGVRFPRWGKCPGGDRYLLSFVTFSSWSLMA